MNSSGGIRSDALTGTDGDALAQADGDVVGTTKTFHSGMCPETTELTKKLFRDTFGGRYRAYSSESRSHRSYARSRDARVEASATCHFGMHLAQHGIYKKLLSGHYRGTGSSAVYGMQVQPLPHALTRRTGWSLARGVIWACLFQSMELRQNDYRDTFGGHAPALSPKASLRKHIP